MAALERARRYVEGENPSPQDRSPADLSQKLHPLCFELGAVVRQRRLSQRRSAYQVATRARIGRQSLFDIESARTAYSVTLLARVCDELGVAVSVAVRVAERRLRRLVPPPGASGK